MTAQEFFFRARTASSLPRRSKSKRRFHPLDNCPRSFCIASVPTASPSTSNTTRACHVASSSDTCSRSDTRRRNSSRSRAPDTVPGAERWRPPPEVVRQCCSRFLHTTFLRASQHRPRDVNSVFPTWQRRPGLDLSKKLFIHHGRTLLPFIDTAAHLKNRTGKSGFPSELNRASHCSANDRFSFLSRRH